MTLLSGDRNGDDRERRARERTSLWNKLVDIGKWLSLEGTHLGCRLAFAVGNRVRVPTVWHWQQELNGAGAIENMFGLNHWLGLPVMTVLGL